VTASQTCAAPGCDGLVVRVVARGRPPIYCSPTCRPSHAPSSGRGHATISVEVEPDNSHLEDPAAARTFIVRLRRGKHSVVVANGAGRFSAAALAEDLRGLLAPKAQQGGRTTN